MTRRSDAILLTLLVVLATSGLGRLAHIQWACNSGMDCTGETVVLVGGCLHGGVPCCPIEVPTSDESDSDESNHDDSCPTCIQLATGFTAELAAPPLVAIGNLPSVPSLIREGMATHPRRGPPPPLRGPPTC